MNNKEIIRNILIEELSKCNNFNYEIKIGDLKIIINTKKLNQILIDNSSYFEGGINSKWRFKQYESKSFYLSYNDIWSKFEIKTGLEYIEIQSIVKDVLEEDFKIYGITAYESYYKHPIQLEEDFKLKGIIPLFHWTRIFTLLFYLFFLKI